MRVSSRNFSTHQLADLGVLLALAGLILAYLLHVLSLSVHILNTILVLPISILALGLCGYELLRQLTSEIGETKELESVRSVLPVMLLFSLYVLVLPWLGFDLGTALFVTVCLRVHGEKRWHWAIAYGFVFGFLLAIIFSSLLPYPMPMSILASEY
jgi:hypothetical protein